MKAIILLFVLVAGITAANLKCKDEETHTTITIPCSMSGYDYKKFCQKLMDSVKKYVNCDHAYSTTNVNCHSKKGDVKYQYCAKPQKK